LGGTGRFPDADSSLAASTEVVSCSTSGRQSSIGAARSLRICPHEARITGIDPDPAWVADDSASGGVGLKIALRYVSGTANRIPVRRRRFRSR